MVARFVEHVPDAPAGGSRHDRVSDTQRAITYDHSRYRAASAVELGFDDGAGSPRIGIGRQILDFSQQQYAFQQLVYAHPSVRGDLDHHVVAAPFLGYEAMFHQFRLTRSASAAGRSILLMAAMMGTFAALAWLIASMVWGLTPSLAATTRTAISVTCARGSAWP